MIGICGAHRTGKTTLARELAKAQGFSFCETKVSEAIGKLGFTPQQGMDFPTRLKVQEYILDAIESHYRAQDGKPFVADRTPLDVLGYSWSEIQRDTLDDPELARLFEAHMDRCLTLTERWFGGLILVPPGIQIEPDPTKAQANRVYIEHIHGCITLAAGHLTARENNVSVAAIGRDTVDLAARIKYTGSFTQHILNAATQDTSCALH